VRWLLGAEKCPSVPVSRNRQGSIGFRLFYCGVQHIRGKRCAVLFSADLGRVRLMVQPVLSSYQDYRFRAPNLLLLRESIEHSIWGPFGVTFMADQGKVALNPRRCGL